MVSDESQVATSGSPIAMRVPFSVEALNWCTSNGPITVSMKMLTFSPEKTMSLTMPALRVPARR